MTNSSSDSLVMRLFKKWYGDFTRDELKKYLFLGLIFAFVIGVYWTIRPLKDSIFGSVVGTDAWLAAAKIVSVVLMFPILALYSKLVDSFPRNKMLILLGLTYGVLMIFWGVFFALPSVGLENTITSPWRFGGWLWYVFVESFGSIVVALFWAFTTDISNPQSARRGFPLVVMVGQVGGIIMPYVLKDVPVWLGSTNAPLVAVCGLFSFIISFLVFIFMRITPKSEMQGFQAAHEHKDGEKEPSFFEGLQLLLKHKYLLGLLACVTIYEIVATFIDFNFKTMVMHTITDGVARNRYLSDYASTVNLVSLICILLGVNNIQRWMGVRFALALMPIILCAFVVLFKIFPVVGVLFWLMIGLKAINYALNGPTLKQLYVPTSNTAKYKAQAWIETFGSRSAKASSSAVNLLKSVLILDTYLALTVYMSLGLLGFWFFVALYLGKKYNHAVETKTVVC